MKVTDKMEEQARLFLQAKAEGREVVELYRGRKSAVDATYALIGHSAYTYELAPKEPAMRKEPAMCWRNQYITSTGRRYWGESHDTAPDAREYAGDDTIRIAVPFREVVEGNEGG